jgi:hypothetical protein
MSAQSDLVVKTVFHEDVRRFKLQRASFSLLRELLGKAYDRLPAGFVIKYTDPEGDVCSIGSDAELEEAFHVSGTTLKVELFAVEDGRQSAKPEPQPEPEPQPSKPEPQPSKPEPQSASARADPKEKLEDTKEEAKGSSTEGAKESETQSASHEEILDLVVEILQDPKVQSEVPAIVENVLNTLKSSDELSIKLILDNLLTGVPSLNQNAALGKLVPLLLKSDCVNNALGHAKQYLPMVLPWLSGIDIAGELSRVLSVIDFAQLKEQIKLAFSQSQGSGCSGFPFGGFPFGACWSDFSDSDSADSAEPSESKSAQAQSEDSKAHLNIKCDGCGTVPICGDRYKCLVCDDFDLCSACEKKDIHPSSHPLLKMKVPARSDVHHNVQCDGCSVEPIRGVRYKCLVCRNFDLCSACEAKNQHPADHTLLKLKTHVGRRGYHGGHGHGRHGHRHGHGGPHGGHSGRWGGHGRHLHRMIMGHPLARFVKGFVLRGGRGWGGWGGCPRSFSGHPRFGACEKRSQGCEKRSQGCEKRSQAESKLQAERVVVEFVRDINLPDGTTVLPDVTLIKSWELKNAGTTKWPEGSKLIFLRGHRELLGEVEEFPVPLAEPGQLVEVSCPIKTPTKPGQYSAYFQVADKDRSLFEGSHRFWVEIVVKAEEKRPQPVEKKEYDPKPEKIVQGLSSTIPSSSSTTVASTASTTSPAPAPATPSKYAPQLSVLEKMGFVNDKLNSKLLERSQGNIEQVVSWLLEMEKTQ